MRIGIDASRGFVVQPTGTERYSWEIIKRMVALPSAKSHEFILYTKSKLSNELAAYFKIHKNVKLREISLPRLWTQLGLAGQTWKDGLDVLWVPAHTLPIFRKPGIATVVTIHGIEYEYLPAYENKLQRWYLPWSTIYATKSATQVISVSEFTKQQLIQRWQANPDKVTVIYEGGVEIQSVKDQVDLLGRFNVRSKGYILFVGTVQPRKNLERLVEAYERILKMSKRGEVKLVIAGKLGWNYQKLLDLIKEKELLDDVLITGYISEDERQVLVQNALAYVQPSITEGFGLPILEAWQAGVPVVSSNGGALAEVVGEAGVLFDPFNVDEISQKLLKIISQPKLRNELIVKGGKRLENFSWDLAAEETLKVLTK